MRNSVATGGPFRHRGGELLPFNSRAKESAEHLDPRAYLEILPFRQPISKPSANRSSEFRRVWGGGGG